jgi:predicted CXXCH cytochrome family protein
MRIKKRPVAALGGILVLLLLLLPASSLAIDNSECLDCHGDENLYRAEDRDVRSHQVRSHLYVDDVKFHNSVHHGRGIACVDCHQDIEGLDFEQELPHRKELAPVRCTTCHADEGDAFIDSVHMRARNKGISMSCHACHDYHYAGHREAASVAERGNDMCLKCHNPTRTHDWLPQKDAHFASVQCTACHAPDVPHHFHLNFYDLVTGAFLSGNQVIEILGIDYEEFMPLLDSNRDRILDNAEFGDLVLLLRQKNVRAVFHAELVAEMQPLVHRINDKEPIRDCGKCHAPDSPFFDAVTIVLKKEDGTVDHHQVARAVLESYHTRHFYALAGTRIRFLDRMGIGMLAAGALSVLLHLIVRVATIPSRRRRKPDTTA